MYNAHIERPARTASRRISDSKRAHRSRDYFTEALRILDNDRTLEPQREHLAALWGLAIELTHRLTQAYAASLDDRAVTASNAHPAPTPPAGVGPVFSGRVVLPRSG